MATINWLTIFFKSIKHVYTELKLILPQVYVFKQVQNKKKREVTALFTEPNVSCGQIDIEKKV